MAKTLEDFRNAYYESSGRASEIARQISFAGIALIWLFRDEKLGLLSVPNKLLVPAMLLVIALFFDLLQYVVGAAIWGWFARHHEKLGKQQDATLSAPHFFNWPAIFLFWSKHALVLAAYFLIFKHIAQTLGKI